jgi:hypothetical protein
VSENNTIVSGIIIVPINKDSVAIEWRCELKTSSHPFKRVRKFLDALTIKDDMSTILLSFRSYLEKTENVYGIHVEKTKVRDTLLIGSQQVFTSPPSTEAIYQLLSNIKNHVMKEGAVETGSPMLNTRNTGPGQYETMVAIPINKAITEQENLFLRRMIPGNILVAEVQGGPVTINNALQQLELYVSDHKLESPAKPFQSLTTDRTTEQDTAKWKTTIYYPVF